MKDVNGIGGERTTPQGRMRNWISGVERWLIVRRLARYGGHESAFLSERRVVTGRSRPHYKRIAERKGGALCPSGRSPFQSYPPSTMRPHLDSWPSVRGQQLGLRKELDQHHTGYEPAKVRHEGDTAPLTACEN